MSRPSGPDGITVRGFLRQRHTNWGHVQRLMFTNRYELLRGGYVEKVSTTSRAG